MPFVVPDILIWARETAGLSLEDAAHHLGIKDARGVSAADRLAAMERGDHPVSRPLLLKMSKQYRRSLLTFYLNRRPLPGDRGNDFRTLPERDVAQESLVDALVREIRARQSTVRAVLEDDEDAQPIPFIGSMTLEDGVGTVMQSIRRTIDLDLAEFRAQASPEAAFALLRRQVEHTGVFVLLAGNLGSHHTTLDVEVFRGFALADPIAPFIVVNDQDTRSAWSFTLLHELTHLWIGATGVSGTFSDTRIERFCNDVAGQMLLPAGELRQLDIGLDTPDHEAIALIDEFATGRHLSRSMVAYRLRNAGQLSDQTWRTFRGIFRTRWRQGRDAQRERQRNRDGKGPNYYVVRRHRLGTALLRFVARNVTGGTLSPTKAGRVLGVKPRNVDLLLSGAALGGQTA